MRTENTQKVQELKPSLIHRPGRRDGGRIRRGWRGRGIGRALIGHVERWAAAHGVERMVLNVSEANEGAIRLYRELGYRDYDRAMLKRLEGP